MPLSSASSFMGEAFFAVMATWKRGRELLIEHIRSDYPALQHLDYRGRDGSSRGAYRGACGSQIGHGAAGADPQHQALQGPA